MSGSTLAARPATGQPAAPISGTGDVITTQYGAVAVPVTTNLAETGTLVASGTPGGARPLDGGSGGGYYVTDYSVYDSALGDVDIEGTSEDGFLPSLAPPRAARRGRA